MPTPKQQYKTALDAVIRRYLVLEDNSIRQLVTGLQDLRVQLAAAVIGGGSEFQAWRLREIQAEVNRILDAFTAQLNANTRQALIEAHALGGASVVDPLRSVQLVTGFSAINPAQINTLVDYSAALIRNISDVMRGQIDVQLRLAALGAKSPYETMTAITDILGVEARAGVWGMKRRPEIVKGIAARAEAITRTELTRLYNTAAHSQQLEAAAAVPGLLKRWIASVDRRTRPSHLTAFIHYFDNPIPVDQPFLVGTSYLMYPGDPAGPAAETLYCRCTSVTVVPGIGVIGTPLDARARAEMEKRTA